MELFNRKYKLTIGQPILAASTNTIAPYTSLQGQISNELDVAATQDRTKKGAVLLTEHNVSFSIEKVNSKSINTCSITIYNPSNDTMSFLQEVSGKKPIIMLEAGYAGSIGKIFVGNIETFTETFTDETRAVTIDCGDGSEVTKAATFVKAYPKNTSHAVIIEDMLETFGLPKGDITIPSGSTKTAMSFAGRSMEEANRFLEPLNSILSIQDSTTFIDSILAASKPIPQNVVYITPQSGQIGSITFIDDSSSGTTKEGDTLPKRGIKIVSLLRHEVLPTQYIATNLNGVKVTLKVTKVTHSGEYEGDEWQTEIEAEEVA